MERLGGSTRGLNDLADVQEWQMPNALPLLLGRHTLVVVRSIQARPIRTNRIERDLAWTQTSPAKEGVQSAIGDGHEIVLVARAERGQC